MARMCVLTVFRETGSSLAISALDRLVRSGRGEVLKRLLVAAACGRCLICCCAPGRDAD
jgi:hypothetical protein